MVSGEPGVIEAVRPTAALVLAAVAAWWLFRRSEARGLLPPLFALAPPPSDPAPGWRRAVAVRRALAAGGLSLVMLLAVFLPLVGFADQAPQPEDLSVPLLFVTHAVLLAGVLLWQWLGFGSLGGARPGGDLLSQTGLRAARLLPELAIGVVAGVAGWLLVIAVVLALAAVLQLGGWSHALPQQQPVMVVWLAGLPAAVRLLVSASAGLFEEAFFRGLLQPRLGIGSTTVLFAIAHLTYGEPFLLVGVVLLSVWFGVLTWWRRSIWAAVVAHAVFDAIQLLVVVPLVLRALPTG